MIAEGSHGLEVRRGVAGYRHDAAEPNLSTSCLLWSDGDL